MNTTTSQTIDALKWICAIMVVFIHTTVDLNGANQDGSFSWTGGVYDSMRILISQGICRIAVPVFFVISGYLFFSKLKDWSWSIWWGKVKSRIGTLLVPYIIWNLIVVIWNVVLYAQHCLRSNIPYDWYFLQSHSGIGWDFLIIPLNYPLWFIKQLMALILITPIIWLIAAKSRWPAIVILFLLYVFDCKLLMPGLFFFSLGAYLRVHNMDLIAIPQRYLIPFFIISFLFLIIMLFTYGIEHRVYNTVLKFFTILGGASLVGITAIGIKKSVIKNYSLLVNSSFFMYAIHGKIVLPVVCNIMLLLIPGTTQAMLVLKYFLAAFITVLAALFLFKTLSIFTPRLLNLLIGGRMKTEKMC